LIIQHNKQDKQKFEDLAEQRFISFNRALNNELSFMQYLAHFFQSRKNISRSEFHQLTQPFLEKHPAINLIAWAPKVPRQNIDQWTAKVYEDALIYFSPFDTPLKEIYKIDKEQKYFYPKLYVEPKSSKKKLLDMSLSKNAMLMASINQAENTRHQITSEAFHLDNNDNSLVVNIFTPVFITDTKSAQYNQLEGVLLLEIKMGEFFDYAITNVFEDDGLKVKLDELDTENILGGKNWDSDKLVNHYLAEEVIDTSATDAIFVEYTGRLWRLSVTAPYHFNEQMTALKENIALLVGSLITLLVTFIVSLQQRQTARVRKLVHKRTQELALSEAISRSILDSAADSIFSVDEQGSISRINPAGLKLSGYGENELIGHSLKKILPECGLLSDEECNLDKFVQDKGAETYVLNKNQEKIDVKLSIRDVGYEGKFKYTCMMHDLTEIKIVQRTLESLSQTDPLTTLYNRRYFDEQMELFWAHAMKEETSLSIMMIDIDHFKLYNDFYGHTKGDECLQKVSLALKNSFNRSIDLVARYGGEEFIVLLPKVTDIEHMAQQCIDNVKALALPHEKSLTTDIVSLSIGIHTIVPKCSDNILEFISQADHALYEAKESGRNQYKIYTTPS